MYIGTKIMYVCIYSSTYIIMYNYVQILFSHRKLFYCFLFTMPMSATKPQTQLIFNMQTNFTCSRQYSHTVCLLCPRPPSQKPDSMYVSHSNHLLCKHKHVCIFCIPQIQSQQQPHYLLSNIIKHNFVIGVHQGAHTKDFFSQSTL